MKIVIICLLSVFMSCWGTKFPSPSETPKEEPQIVYVEDTAKVAELKARISLLEDSLKFYRDSIPYDTYINARRIEKIKYYLSITEKKPSNQKFFYGWIRRTMSEK